MTLALRGATALLALFYVYGLVEGWLEGEPDRIFQTAFVAHGLGLRETVAIELGGRGRPNR